MKPTATLGIEAYMVNPPKPAGIGVYVGKELIATVTLEEFKRCAAKLEEMEDARR